MNSLEGNKLNNRITIAVDDHTYNLLNELIYNSGTSRSELIRKAIKFYHKFKKVFDKKENGVVAKVNTYLELLSHGEHIILDVDHYLTFLK
ncbi:MAG: ribbon-helix-helix protein, CopG family, partial [Promethearchaeota archaeon]